MIIANADVIAKRIGSTPRMVEERYKKLKRLSKGDGSTAASNSKADPGDASTPDETPNKKRKATAKPSTPRKKKAKAKGTADSDDSDSQVDAAGSMNTGDGAGDKAQTRRKKVEIKPESDEDVAKFEESGSDFGMQRPSTVPMQMAAS